MTPPRCLWSSGWRPGEPPPEPSEEEDPGDDEEDRLKTGEQEAVEGEIGDLLFVVINIARFLKVDPEQALRKTNNKFRRRFAHVEEGLGRPVKEASVAEMEALWQEAKRLGK